MNPLFLGNLLSGIGCILMVAIGLLRKKSHILIAQSFQCGFMGVGNLILGGVSGFIANVVSIIRNLVFVKFRSTTALKVFFIALQVLLSLGALNDGWISWLPILAAALFTWCLDTNSEAKLKLCILATQVMWLTYDIYYRNYVATTFDILTMLSNTIGYFMVRRQK
ncbi:MAG: YgjV family protein [Oscillospiraceae bacterium]|nr:YgjV family protein [Oscillospiraceae bacterium]